MRVHVDILPHLASPHLLTDWLTRAVDAGGLPGMLALHGIFTLVTRHGLEYPRFYARLYSLLTPSALMARFVPPTCMCSLIVHWRRRCGVPGAFIAMADVSSMMGGCIRQKGQMHLEVE